MLTGSFRNKMPIEKIQIEMESYVVKKVDAICSYDDIQQISQYLRKQSLRDHLLFRLGINLGLRVPELLNLKVEDVKGKDRLVIKDAKQGRSYEFLLSESLVEEIAYFIGNREDGLLFRSRNSGGKLTRQRVYLILRRAAEGVGVDCSIGTHTLRKTFGYWAYQKGASIESIRRFFGHATVGVTLRYIGVSDKKKERMNIFAPLDL